MLKKAQSDITINKAREIVKEYVSVHIPTSHYQKQTTETALNMDNG
jgi:hypothetical protein